MIAASVLGLPAIFLLITVLPCIRMGHEPGAAKYRRSQLGGILIILLGKAPAGLEPVPCSSVFSGRISAGWAGHGALSVREDKRHGQEREEGQEAAGEAGLEGGL